MNIFIYNRYIQQTNQTWLSRQPRSKARAGRSLMYLSRAEYPLIVLKGPKSLLRNETSRSTGSGSNNNRSSIHAEEALLNSLSRSNPDVIRQKGRNCTILIDNSGKCSRPCKACYKKLLKILPLCKISYVDEEQVSHCVSLNNIDKPPTYSFGTQTRFRDWKK